MGLEISGYEIHAGHSETHGPALLELEPSGNAASSPDGCSALGGRVFGSYLHGIFDSFAFRRAWLASLGHSATGPGQTLAEARQKSLDRLAEAVSSALEMDNLRRIIGL